ncbi:MarR family winged helix-turn-helix transcriptional regulator [Nonomuraea typhae]|uniref:MarR family winged helix-turn-helix transcriptional regulator n=1 Tax=Nonomuraea typhae TaxID=2603600 RepID=A0ABW7YX89_9ACTN
MAADEGSVRRAAVTVSQDEAEEQGRQVLRAHEATWALWAVLRTADEARHAMAKDLGLPYTDALALEHVLSADTPIGPGELGRRLGVSTASATVLVDRLVAGGRLVRHPDLHDGRRRVLQAAEQARKDAITAMTPLLRTLDAATARLDDGTTAAVVAYLRDIAEAQRDYSRSSRVR